MKIDPSAVLKQILVNEVFPAIGCTEPAACAYAAAVAAEHLGRPAERLALGVDLGTYKNGAAVVVPHCGGAKGNRIAAAVGSVLGRSDARLEVLRDVTPAVLTRARELVDGGACAYSALTGQTDFRVEVRVDAAGHSARCVLSEGHANIERIDRDAEVVYRRADPSARDDSAGYREAIKDMSLADLLAVALALDDNDRAYLRRGVAMNLAMADRDTHVRGAAYPLRRMFAAGILADDLFYRVKTRLAAAVDARMAGVPQAVMTSGGSGNQGLLAVLTPHLVGQERHVSPPRVIESIAVAHVLNAYAKRHLGELSVICGCAVAAGLAAAAAIVYQHVGADVQKIGYAIQNVIADLSGLICDGAKPGCAMKTVSGVDAALRAGFMAIEGFCVSHDDGVLGRTAEESIRNLGRISIEGMLHVDPTVVKILADKAAGSGAAE